MNVCYVYLKLMRGSGGGGSGRTVPANGVGLQGSGQRRKMTRVARRTPFYTEGKIARDLPSGKHPA